jgi:hypothetical protein
MVIKINCVATMIILILGVVPSAYAHSFDYQHGYNAGQQGGRNGVLTLEAKENKETPHFSKVG